MTSDYSAARVKNRYRGRTAEMYEEKRAFGKGKRKWDTEHAAVAKLIANEPEGSLIADIPVGTGRYASIYEARRFRVFGLDTSQDMLDIAAKAMAEHGVSAQFRIHDILEPLPESYDVVVCTRLVNHFTLEETKLAVKNLLTAAPVVILGLREPKKPTEKNWHLMSKILPSDGIERDRVVMSDGEKSRYIMAKLTTVSHVG